MIWYSSDTAKMQDFATIVDVCCHLTGKDPFGRVLDGYIKIRGYTTQMTIETKVMLAPDGRLKMTREGVKDCYGTLDSVQDIEDIQLGILVTCLDIMRDSKYASGLVLVPVNDQSGRYHRIGFSTMLVEHFEDSALAEITIV